MTFISYVDLVDHYSDSSALLILMSAFFIVNFYFIGADPFRSAFLEFSVRIFRFLSGLDLFSPVSPSGLSFFTFILLIPFPRSLIFTFSGAPEVYGVDYFSADSPLEPRRTRFILNFILLP